MAEIDDVPPTHHVRIIEDRWATLRGVIQALAIVLAGAWGFFVFVYQDRIKPAQEPPALTIDVSLDRGRVVRGVRVARLNVVLRNSGHADTDVVADAVNIYGARYRPTATPAPSSRATPGATYVFDGTVPTTRNELLFSLGELRDAAVGGRTGTHILLRSGDALPIHFDVAVREGRFDVLRGEASIVFARFAPEATATVPLALARREDGSIRIVPRPGPSSSATVFSDQLETTAPL